MKKAKIVVDEKLTFRRDIEVLIPNNISDVEMETILNEAEREGSLSDFMRILMKYGIECPDGYDDDFSSPWDLEVECEEFDFMD